MGFKTSGLGDGLVCDLGMDDAKGRVEDGSMFLAWVITDNVARRLVQRNDDLGLLRSLYSIHVITGDGGINGTSPKFEG